MAAPQYRYLLVLGSGDEGEKRNKSYQTEAKRCKKESLAEWMREILDREANFRTQEDKARQD